MFIGQSMPENVVGTFGTKRKFGSFCTIATFYVLATNHCCYIFTKKKREFSKNKTEENRDFFKKKLINLRDKYFSPSVIGFSTLHDTGLKITG